MLATSSARRCSRIPRSSWSWRLGELFGPRPRPGCGGGACGRDARGQCASAAYGRRVVIASLGGPLAAGGKAHTAPGAQRLLVLAVGSGAQEAWRVRDAEAVMRMAPTSSNEPFCMLRTNSLRGPSPGRRRGEKIGVSPLWGRLLRVLAMSADGLACPRPGEAGLVSPPAMPRVNSASVTKPLETALPSGAARGPARAASVPPSGAPALAPSRRLTSSSRLAPMAIQVLCALPHEQHVDDVAAPLVLLLGMAWASPSRRARSGAPRRARPCRAAPAPGRA